MIEVHIGEVASYTASGVDVEAGDTISRLWQEAAQQTYGNRKDRFGQLAVSSNDFADVRGLDLDLVQGKTGLILHGGVDGVGTKPELAERLSDRRQRQYVMDVSAEVRDHAGIFHDLVAMVADDIARDGGEPVAIYTLFDTRTLDAEQAVPIVQQLALGAIAACKVAQVVYPNGETAELGDRIGGYGEFNYNLGGFAVGVSHRDRILRGDKIRTGDSIVALREPGFRANGMSLVREVLVAELGESWHLTAENLASDVLQPSIIYTPALVDMHGGYDLEREPKADLSAIIHVTGGGIPGKLQRKLAVTGKGAVLDNLFAPSEIMQRVQGWSLRHKELATPDASLYQALNAGNGALVITSQPDRVMEIATAHSIESQVAGEVVDEPGIKLKSKGLTHPGKWINFIPRTA